jgi:hypothetical protein
MPINGDLTLATRSDPSRPICAAANSYADALVTDSTRSFRDKLRSAIAAAGAAVRRANQTVRTARSSPPAGWAVSPARRLALA